mmetsp:Transcript_25026/g.28848  ORF Transcript_25026/g.28848 Transcript_25026/m.28848 type:complete len:387 (-) Transcript_25026:700-1860(-)
MQIGANLLLRKMGDIDQLAIGPTDASLSLDARSIPIPAGIIPSESLPEAALDTQQSYLGFQRTEKQSFAVPGGMMNDPKMIVIISGAALAALFILGFGFFLKFPRKNKVGHSDERASSFGSSRDSSFDFDEVEDDFLSTVKVDDSKKGKEEDNSSITRLQFNRQSTYMRDGRESFAGVTASASKGSQLPPRTRSNLFSNIRFLSGIDDSKKNDDEIPVTDSSYSGERSDTSDDKRGNIFQRFFGFGGAGDEEDSFEDNMNMSRGPNRFSKRVKSMKNLRSLDVPVSNLILEVTAEEDSIAPLTHSNIQLFKSVSDATESVDSFSHPVPVANILTNAESLRNSFGESRANSFLDVAFAEKTLHEGQLAIDVPKQVKSGDDMLDVCDM